MVEKTIRNIARSWSLRMSLVFAAATTASRGVLATTRPSTTAAFVVVVGGGGNGEVHRARSTWMMRNAFPKGFGFGGRPCPQPTCTWLMASAKDENTTNQIPEPTWTYLPYDPKKKTLPQRRPFSTWTVPKTVDIPEERLEIQFVRSSGAGGQNVNKVNTKVEMRFRVDDADWIPGEVRDRLKDQQANRINKEGYLSLQSQEHRTQAQNRKAAMSKLQEMLLEAWPRPKIRKQRKGISMATKERNKAFKQKRSEVKATRKKVDF